MKLSLKSIICAATILSLITPVYGVAAKTEETKRCPKIEPALRRAGMPVATFSYIAWRESKCQPKVIGWNYRAGKSHLDCRRAPAEQYRKCPAISSYDSGLFQINSSWRTLTSQICKSKFGDLTVLLQPRCNLAVAEYLYKYGGGLHNWGVRASRP